MRSGRRVRIGDSGKGKVFRVWDADAGCYYAEKYSRESLDWEAFWMQQLEGFAVPKFIKLEQKGEYSILTMEYFPGKTLKERMLFEELRMEQRVRIMEHLLEELIKIRNKYPDLVFCDLKPSNIIVDHKEQIRLIDLEAVRQGKKRGKRCMGTFPYAPAELKEGKPGKKSDIYSLGQIFFLMNKKKKDWRYYWLIAPYIVQKEEKRNGDLEGWHRKLIWYQKGIRGLCWCKRQQRKLCLLLMNGFVWQYIMKMGLLGG